MGVLLEIMVAQMQQLVALQAHLYKLDYIILYFMSIALSPNTIKLVNISIHPLDC